MQTFQIFSPRTVFSRDVGEDKNNKNAGYNPHTTNRNCISHTLVKGVEIVPNLVLIETSDLFFVRK